MIVCFFLYGGKMPIVKFQKLRSWAKMPKYATAKASGADLFSVEKVSIGPGGTKLVSTGIRIELPEGYEAQIRSKGGLATKGIFVVNSPGTIDNDYRGELKVILHNLPGNRGIQTLERGDKIAQLVISPIIFATFEETEEVSTDTGRGEGAFGSTGR